jgi:hypothetical protein
MKTAAEAVSDKTRRASHLLSDVFWSKKTPNRTFRVAPIVEEATIRCRKLIRNQMAPALGRP